MVDLIPGPIHAENAPCQKIRLFAADMESTIIEQEMIDVIAEHIGCGKQVAAITRAAMEGAIDFEAALQARVALFAGLDIATLDQLYDRHVTLMPGAETMMRTLKAHGIATALVTGGFSIFAERVAARLGFDSWRANTLDIADGRLTGRLVPPIIGRAGKRRALEDIAAWRGISLSETAAIGDGANDLDMLMAAGVGIAFRAKPIVMDAMLSRAGGAVLDDGNLTDALPLIGISIA
ncbi:MAG: phosphoserine phosphatase SerB [Hyphomicrobium sp.]|nr:phosphoserine phosphatase SerB [Hyphomicrobium sp.]